MMEIRVQHITQKIEDSSLLQVLEKELDKQKFYGTILLKFEAGKLCHVKAEQSFTVDGLISYLNS